MKYKIKQAGLPIAILLCLLTWDLLSLVYDIPDASSVTDTSLKFQKHYVWSVAVISFAENLIFVSAMFPASVAILIIMASTAGNLSEAVTVWGLIYLGSLAALTLNFWIARIFLEKPDVKFSQDSLNLTRFLHFWHPHWASIASTYSGRNSEKFRHFIFEVSLYLFVWHVFWGVIMYNFGGKLNSDGVSLHLVFYIYLVILIYKDSRV